MLCAAAAPAGRSVQRFCGRGRGAKRFAEAALLKAHQQEGGGWGRPGCLTVPWSSSVNVTPEKGRRQHRPHPFQEGS